MKKLLKIAGIIVGLLVVLLVAGTLILKALFPPEKIKEMVLPKISETMNRPVALEGVGFSVFPRLSISLNGLIVANTSRPGFDANTPLVHLGQFRLVLNWKSLFTRKLDLARIAFDDLQIVLEKAQDGTMSIDDLGPPKDTLAKIEEKKPVEKTAFSLPAAFAFSLQSFSLSNASIKFINKKDKQTVILGDINQDVKVSVDNKMEAIETKGRLTVKGIRVIAKGVPTDVRDLSLFVDHDLLVNLPAGKAEIRSIRAGLQKFTVTLTGSVTDFMNIPAYDITLETADITIPDLLREIPRSLVPQVADVRAEGAFKLKVSAKGAADPAKPEALPEVRGSLAIKNVKASYKGMPKSLDRMNADIRFTADALSIPSLEVISGSDQISVTASVENFKAPRVDARVRALVNLAGIKDLAPLPEGVSISGNIEADVTAKGLADPKDPSKLALNGSVNLTDIAATTPALGKPVKVNGSVALSNKAIELKGLKILIGSSDITAQARVADYLGLVLAKPGEVPPKTTVDFKVTSANLNLDEILNPSGAESAPETPRAASTATGDEPLTLPPLPNVAVKGGIEAAKITLKKVDLTRLSTRIDVSASAVSLATTASLYSGTILHDLKINIAPGNVSLTNVLNTERIEANDFVSRFRNFLPESQSSSPLFKKLKDLDGVVSGKMTMKSRFATRGYTQNQFKKNLEGEILLDIFDGRLAANKAAQSAFSAMGKVNDLLKAAGQPSPFPAGGEMTFNRLHNTIRVKDEIVTMDDFTFDSKEGNWFIKGTVTFAGVMDMNLADKLTQPISAKLLAGQTKAAGAASKGVDALAGKVGGAAGGLLKSAAQSGMDALAIPADREGRVTVNIGLTGPADSPSPKFNGFGAAGDKAGSQQAAQKPAPTPQKQAVQQVQQQTQQVQQQVQQKVQQAAEPVKQEVNKAKELIKKKKLPF